MVDVPEHFQQPAACQGNNGRCQCHEGSTSRSLDPTFKKLGVHEEVSKDSATSTPSLARLTPVTKPNVHGGPARKNARVVIFELSRGAPR